MSYITKAYRAQGGEQIVIECGGTIDLRTGSQVLTNGSQASAIADAETSHDLNATFSDTEVEAALNALGGKINSILTVLRNAGIIASS